MKAMCTVTKSTTEIKKTSTEENTRRERLREGKKLKEMCASEWHPCVELINFFNLCFEFYDDEKWTDCTLHIA